MQLRTESPIDKPIKAIYYPKIKNECGDVFTNAKTMLGDHSCPPSSLVFPKRVVGCRGGGRYVEGCWGFQDYSRFQSFQVFVPRCTIMFQDLTGFTICCSKMYSDSKMLQKCSRLSTKISTVFS